MLRNVYLHGPLATRYGSDPVVLDADDMPTLFRALDCAYPDFLIELRKHQEIALAAKDGDDVTFITTDNMGWTFGSKPDVHLVTSEQGSGAQVAAWVLNMAWAATTGWTAVAYVAITIAVNIAISYVLGKIAMHLADTPETSGPADERRSALFDQAVNLQGQGHPVPLLYGRFKCGSVVVSAAVTTEKNAIAIGDLISMVAPGTKTGNVFDNDVEGSTLTLTGFTVDGTSFAPAATYSITGCSLTIAANGNYTLITTGEFVGSKKGTYTATSTLGNTTQVPFTLKVDEAFVDYSGMGY